LSKVTWCCGTGSLARGAGGYFNVLNGSPVQVQTKTLETVVDAYLQAHGTSSAKTDTPGIQDVNGVKG
jgi:hypothetical protein